MPFVLIAKQQFFALTCFYVCTCRFGVRCNAVLPGFIQTPMTDAVPEKVLEKASYELAFAITSWVVVLLQ